MLLISRARVKAGVGGLRGRCSHETAKASRLDQFLVQALNARRVSLCDCGCQCSKKTHAPLFRGSVRGVERRFRGAQDNRAERRMQVGRRMQCVEEVPVSRFTTLGRSVRNPKHGRVGGVFHRRPTSAFSNDTGNYGRSDSGAAAVWRLRKRVRPNQGKELTLHDARHQTTGPRRAQLLEGACSNMASWRVLRGAGCENAVSGGAFADLVFRSGDRSTM